MCVIFAAHIVYLMAINQRVIKRFIASRNWTFNESFCRVRYGKIRLTGGEPTMRRDFIDIIATIKQNQAIKKIAVTTNGYRLAKMLAIGKGRFN